MTIHTASTGFGQILVNDLDSLRCAVVSRWSATFKLISTTQSPSGEPLAFAQQRGEDLSDGCASRLTDSATSAECRPCGQVDLPTSAGVDTQRDVEAVGGSSRIIF
ncbi:hypothetical protein [Bradyrhizobium sp. F1.4.3]|uniref:hypothetical protein n=1 Tax=Bradyrhizobium sp. F1.4.3 TaxID=3156356 RepID=UPI003394E42A